MDLMKMAAEQFLNKSGDSSGGMDLDQIGGVLQKLMGDSNGQMDLQGLLSTLNNGGLADLASSWLGQGGNAEISGDQVNNLFDDDKLDQAASELNIDKSNLLSGLSAALPELIDKASPDGQLGDLGSLLGGLKKLF